MTNGFFDTLREQIEKDFLPACLRECKRSVVLDMLRTAAMRGATEERSRILKILYDDAARRPMAQSYHELEARICEVSVWQVLGW